ncbi:hypothetical protein [Algoriphagus sanaruensis]|uniref:Uncharacterized protein n=1 Tax=Algoriphagus sanaruensis TaxID=1727163 RepID=A0A142EQY8_9BACT|nr:hypothetical protein [Algoriphagus sanaruensis]AMQ57543.1 hypothetical protein AO498_13925 [Algoriphagus sanaruensis]
MRSKFLWLLLWGCFFSIESWAIESEVNWRSFTIIKDRGDGGISKIKRHLSEEEKAMVDQAEKFENSVFQYSIIQEKSEYYLIRDCQMNYWKWNGNIWVPQLDFEGVGSYCGLNFFSFKDEYYTFGNNGFWESNSDIYLLNQKTKKPEFVFVQNQPLNLNSGVVFFYEEGILSLFGASFNRRIEFEYKHLGHFFLNLEEKKWQEVEINWYDREIKKLFDSKEFPRSRPIDTPNFGIFAFEYQGVPSNLTVLIFDKRTMEIFQNSIPFFDAGGVFGYLIGENEEVVFLRSEALEDIRLSLPQLKQEAKLVGKISIQNEVFPYQNGMYFIVLSVLIGGIVGTWFWRKKKLGLADEILSQEPDSMALDERIFPFLDVQETIISQEKMDELLGLEHGLAFDLRKVHRARKIREINEMFISQFGYPLITRERHTMDRRMILYCIGKIFIDKEENKKILAKT